MEEFCDVMSYCVSLLLHSFITMAIGG